jgi:DNA-binding XRE family transcriptional regulator
MSNIQNIQNNLQKYRLYKQLTQGELSNILQISIHMIRRIEKYSYYPNYIYRSKICEYFGINQDQMFYKNEEEEN